MLAYQHRKIGDYTIGTGGTAVVHGYARPKGFSGFVCVFPEKKNFGWFKELHGDK